jgi:hypothetical protein
MFKWISGYIPVANNTTDLSHLLIPNFVKFVANAKIFKLFYRILYDNYCYIMFIIIPLLKSHQI